MAPIPDLERMGIAALSVGSSWKETDKLKDDLLSLVAGEFFVWQNHAITDDDFRSGGHTLSC